PPPCAATGSRPSRTSPAPEHPLMNPNTTATELLREEHRLILRVVDAFERVLDAHDADAPPVDTLADFVVFFRLFTDACHHGKEEDVLFAVMEANDAGAEGPIALMREEHVQGRQLVRRIDEQVQRLRAGSAVGRALDDAARDYVDFIRAHIGKEDEGVFAVADDTIRGHACSSLGAAHETACSGRLVDR